MLVTNITSVSLGSRQIGTGTLWTLDSWAPDNLATDSWAPWPTRPHHHDHCNLAFIRAVVSDLICVWRKRRSKPSKESSVSKKTLTGEQQLGDIMIMIMILMAKRIMMMIMRFRMMITMTKMIILYFCWHPITRLFSLLDVTIINFIFYWDSSA